MEEKKPTEAPPILPQTKAPRPPTPLRASSWKPPAPGPSQPLTDLPAYYPNNLKVRTLDVIGTAIKAFPNQSQILDLCKKVLAKLSTPFCAEVQAGRLRADLAPSHMSDLIHSLLVYNVSNDSERYCLEQALKRSKEWSSFIRRLKKCEERDAIRGKPGVTREVALATIDRPWDRIDHELVGLRWQEAAPGLQRELKAMQDEVYARYAKNHNAASVPVGLMEAELKMAERWAETLRDTYGSVWSQSQEQQKSPDFCRTVFERGILPLLEGREATAREVLQNYALRTHRNVGPHLAELSRAMARLKSNWRAKAEIEARELEHRQRRRAAKFRVSRRRLSRQQKRSGEPKAAQVPFKHSVDYRSIWFQGKQYSLTTRQAQVVEMLHELYKNGTPETSLAHILDRLGTPNSRLRDTFKNTPLWGKGKLIVAGGRRGTVRLNLPDEPTTQS